MWHSLIGIITVLKQEPGVNFVLSPLSVDKRGDGLTVRVCLEAQKLPFQKKAKRVYFYRPAGINGLDLDGNHNWAGLPRDLVGLVPYCVEGT